jgi:outer membrane lipoprotein-sorting protein
MTALVLGSLCTAAWAADSAQDIIRKANEGRAAGNSIQTIELTMTLSSGGTKQYVLDTRTRDSGGIDGSRAEIQQPQELAGTTLLSISGASGTSETYMYMPAGKSLMQIEGNSRKGPFMGTDFSYEDLDFGDIDAGSHTLLGDETISVGGAAYDCHKIETTPNAGIDTAYGTIITWIDKDSYTPRQVLMLAADGTTELKRMTIEAVAGNGSTLPTRVRMENFKKGSSTVMVVLAHRLDVPEDELPADLFDPAQFETN